MMPARWWVAALAFGAVAAACTGGGSSPTASSTTAATTSTSATGAPPTSASASTAASSPGGTAQPASQRPNFVLLLTDDLDQAEVSVMPNLQRLLVAQGTTFTSAHVSVSLCCPSRTTILTGRYSHNTGIETNGGANGGFETAYATHLESSTIATWLHEAGYRTALIGKYLNGYPRTATPTYVPPGWDVFDSASNGNAYGEFNYVLNDTGVLEAHGAAATDYGTDVYTAKAVDVIRSAAAASTPFFVYLAVYAPHQPATPAPRHAQLFADAQAPRTPSYDEADVSDKPAWVQQRPLMGPVVKARVDALYRRRLQSLQAVDDAIATLVDTLQATGQLDHTYVVFTSDNGFHLGQHRLPAGKQTAYEEDITVPLVVTGPGVAAGRTDAHLVGNVDFAPTFAELAGVQPGSPVDGRSLVPLLDGTATSGGSTSAGSTAGRFDRQAYLVEHWQERNGAAAEPSDGVATEPADQDQTDTTVRQSRAALNPIPEYHAIRTSAYTYVEYVTGERELYDLSADPAQLQNIASTAAPELLGALTTQLHALVGCQAAACRVAGG